MIKLSFSLALGMLLAGCFGEEKGSLATDDSGSGEEEGFVCPDVASGDTREAVFSQLPVGDWFSIDGMEIPFFQANCNNKSDLYDAGRELASDEVYHYEFGQMWGTYRWDMYMDQELAAEGFDNGRVTRRKGSWTDHPVHCGYSDGFENGMSWIAPSDVVAAGISDSGFVNNLCGTCLKLEHANGMSEVVVVTDKGWGGQFAHQQLDISPGLASYFNNYSTPTNVGNRHGDRPLKVTPVECIYGSGKLDYYVHENSHGNWLKVNLRKLPRPIEKAEVCWPGHGGWRSLSREVGNFSLNGGPKYGERTLFKLTYPNGEVFYDEIAAGLQIGQVTTGDISVNGQDAINTEDLHDCTL